MTVIGDPKLVEKLRNYPQISHLIENPKFIEVAEDEEIQKALEASDFFSLLDNPKIAELIKN